MFAKEFCHYLACASKASAKSDGALSLRIALMQIFLSVQRLLRLRNTVDSLTTIHDLKECGTEIFFEKEGIWTMDSAGEMLITIMSSLAQEESWSISENVALGKRKGMQDGKVSANYPRFLGCGKGMTVIRRKHKSYRAFTRCTSKDCRNTLLQKLIGKGIPSPAGKEKRYRTTVRSILQNEKYRGSALLQKTFTEDFLTKKHKHN